LPISRLEQKEVMRMRFDAEDCVDETFGGVASSLGSESVTQSSDWVSYICTDAPAIAAVDESYTFSAVLKAASASCAEDALVSLTSSGLIQIGSGTSMSQVLPHRAPVQPVRTALQQTADQELSRVHAAAPDVQSGDLVSLVDKVFASWPDRVRG
jgi:hypothetical protein